jgi:hypothetical protein
VAGLLDDEAGVNGALQHRTQFLALVIRRAQRQSLG